MAGTILIVDDVATNRIVLKVKLAAACYDTLQASDGTSALRLAREVRPNLILLDVMLPDVDGIEVCKSLRADPVTRDIPVVMVTTSTDIEARLAALQAGADEFLSKPLDEPMLLARLRSLMRAREMSEELRLRDTTTRDLGFAEPVLPFEGPGTFALIAARKETALAWRRDLAPLLRDRLLVIGHTEVLAEAVGSEALGASHPDVFLIAADLAQTGEGLRLMSELRSRPGTRHAAICIALADDTRDGGAMALDLGANDLIAAGCDPREIALRLTTQLRRKRQADRLRASVRDGLRAAVTDPLTGLYNRRYALPHLSRIAERAALTGRPFAVMVLDIDRVKTVNDTWGHAAGDAVLVEVATRLRDNLRAVDLVARIGGEEFLVALPDTPLGLASMAAERLCQVVHQTPVALPSGPQISVTLSIGLSIGGLSIGGGRDTANPADVLALIDQADHAMLAAKAEGRNQVTVSQSATRSGEAEVSQKPFKLQCFN